MSPSNPAMGSADRGKPSRGDPLARLAPAHPRQERLRAVADTRSAASATGAAALEKIAGTVDEDPLVRAAAIAALAAQGRAVTLEARPPAPVRSAARKAAAILARHRAVAAAERGEALQLPAVSRVRTSAAGIAILSRMLPASEAKRAATDSSLVGAKRGEVMALRCEGYEDNEYAILLRSDFDPARLLQAPARPAQVAVHHTDEVDVWTVPFEVLTSPAGRGRVHIVLIDDRGRPRFAGSATIQGPEVKFDVGTVSRPGASGVTVRGRVVNGRISIDEARAGAQGAAPRRPRKLKGGTLDGTVRQRRR